MRNGSFMQKAGAVLMASVLAVSGVVALPATTEAAEYGYYVSDSGTAAANTDYSWSFDVTGTNDVYFDISVPTMTAGMMTLYYNGEYVTVANLTADEYTWMYDAEYNEYYVDFPLSLYEGNWTVVLNFETSVDFIFVVAQEKQGAVISNQQITVTVGFSETLSVQGAEVTSWTSSDNKVATVNSSGKVTGKKAGSARITATTADGQELTCTVSVAKNEYSETRSYASQVPYGNSTVQVYKMSYNKKGDLVLKASILNNKGNRATKIKKLTITVKNSNGKTIGTYTVKNKKVSINSGSSKDFTFTIKKAKLKIKKADLRTATYTPKGTIVYVQ